MGVLLEFISVIHRVLWVSGDPVDDRNIPKQGTHPLAISFLMWILGKNEVQ